MLDAPGELVISCGVADHGPAFAVTVAPDCTIEGMKGLVS